MHKYFLGYTTVCNHHSHPQPATTTYSYPQPPTTTHSHPQRSTTSLSYPQPPTTTQKLPKKPKRVNTETDVDFDSDMNQWR